MTNTWYWAIGSKSDQDSLKGDGGITKHKANLDFLSEKYVLLDDVVDFVAAAQAIDRLSNLRNPVSTQLIYQGLAQAADELGEKYEIEQLGEIASYYRTFKC